jgi:hypothetical protein
MRRNRLWRDNRRMSVGFRMWNSVHENPSAHISPVGWKHHLPRGLCPQTPDIFRFGPIACYQKTNKAMSPRQRHRPCHWVTMALGLLVSIALSSIVTYSEYQMQSALLSDFVLVLALFSCCWLKAVNVGGLGAEPPVMGRRAIAGIRKGRMSRRSSTPCQVIACWPEFPACLFRNSPIQSVSGDGLLRSSGWKTGDM